MPSKVIAFDEVERKPNFGCVDFGLSFHVLSISGRGSVGFFYRGILRLSSNIFNSLLEYDAI